MKKRNDISKFWGKRLLVLLAAMLMVSFSACSPQSTPPGPDATSGTVGQIGYTYYRWKEGLSLMIWHDAAGSSMSNGSSSTTDPVYRLHGYAESRDRQRVEWRLQTSDGMTAQFEIDNTSYDLSDGALFIITTQGGKTEIQQLDRDLSSVQPNRDSCLAFAESDPDLAKFIIDYHGVATRSWNDTASGGTEAKAQDAGITPLPDWITYHSLEGEFSLQYPSNYGLHPGQIPSADGVWVSVPNTLTLLSSDFALSVQYEALQADLSLAEYVNETSQCYQISADQEHSLTLDGQEALLFGDTNCGLSGITEVYAAHNHIGYHILIQSYLSYDHIEESIKSVLSTFKFESL